MCKSGRTYGPCGTIAGLQCDPGFTCVLESDVVSDSAGGCCKDGIYSLTMFLTTSVLKCYEHIFSVVYSIDGLCQLWPCWSDILLQCWLPFWFQSSRVGIYCIHIYIFERHYSLFIKNKHYQYIVNMVLSYRLVIYVSNFQIFLIKNLTQICEAVIFRVVPQTEKKNE